MAWFGKVSLGGLQDLAGAVNKISESVKNIEKNFDTALGLEDKPPYSQEGSGAWSGMPDFMGFMGQQSEQKETAEDAAARESDRQQSAVEDSAAAAPEEGAAEVGTEEVTVASKEEEKKEEEEETEVVKVEETVPVENVDPAESVEIGEERERDEVDQPKIDFEKEEVSEVVEDVVSSQEVAVETESSAEREVAAESEAKKTSDDNAEREAESVAVEIAPDVSDHATSGELPQEAEEKPSAVGSDVAGEEVTDSEPVKMLLHASDVVLGHEEIKREDCDRKRRRNLPASRE